MVGKAINVNLMVHLVDQAQTGIVFSDEYEKAKFPDRTNLHLLLVKSPNQDPYFCPLPFVVEEESSNK
jgi:hypothetical protein